MTENRKRKAIIISIGLRPMKSLGLPRKSAPKTDPINIIITAHPCIAAFNWNSIVRKGIAPLITAKLYPTNNPPRLAINIATNKALFIVTGLCWFKYDPYIFLPVYFDPEWFLKSHVADKFILEQSSLGPKECNIIKTFVNIWINGQVANAE